MRDVQGSWQAPSPLLPALSACSTVHPDVGGDDRSVTRGMHTGTGGANAEVAGRLDGPVTEGPGAQLAPYP